ncbi:MAG TPA: hypothetical protein VK668_24555 [Mucilaginibacter sp.]|nr:hypothetical protein [Mucilaginibacter sp.]
MEAANESPLEALKAYAETRLKLVKYRAVDKGSAVAADIIADLVLVFCLLFILLFASVTLACYLAGVLQSEWAGFGCVTAFYIVTALVIGIFKKGLERPIINLLVKKMLK